MSDTPKGKALMDNWPQYVMMALASAIVGGGTSFGVTQNAGAHPEAQSLREIEKEVDALRTDVLLLRTQLDFMTRGEVNFLASRTMVSPMAVAPPAFDIMESVEPPAADGD